MEEGAAWSFGPQRLEDVEGGTVLRRSSRQARRTAACPFGETDASDEWKERKRQRRAGL